MNLYHGSDVIVNKPKILKSNRLLDFGIGFYTTSNKKQAVRWAEKVSSRNNRNNIGDKFLSIYNFDMEKAKKQLNIIQFTQADEKWLEFITANRSGKDISQKYDIVMGPVADDNVYLTVKLFETGVLNKEETLKRLKIEKLFDQILFHTDKSLESCIFKCHENLGGIING